MTAARTLARAQSYICVCCDLYPFFVCFFAWSSRPSSPSPQPTRGREAKVRKRVLLLHRGAASGWRQPPRRTMGRPLKGDRTILHHAPTVPLLNGHHPSIAARYSRETRDGAKAAPPAFGEHTARDHVMAGTSRKKKQRTEFTRRRRRDRLLSSCA